MANDRVHESKIPHVPSRYSSNKCVTYSSGAATGLFRCNPLYKRAKAKIEINLERRRKEKNRFPLFK
jgi:hypothetical protein